MSNHTTFYKKLVDSHTVTRIDDQNVLLYVDLHLMNEYTSPQAFSGLAEKGSMPFSVERNSLNATGQERTDEPANA